MAVGAAGAAAWWPADAGRTTQAPVAGSPDDVTVQRCTEVDNGALDPADFGPGSKVVVSDAAGSVTQLVVLSDDGGSWAACWLQDDPGAEFNGYADTFPMDPAQGAEPGSDEPGVLDRSETAGYGWGHGTFWYYDRFPPAVAEVDLRFRGGPTLTRPTVDGFVAAVATNPDFTMNGGVEVLFTLRDANGDVLGSTGGWPALGPEQSLPRRYWTLVPSR